MKSVLFSILILLAFSLNAQEHYKGLAVLKDTTRTRPAFDKPRPIEMKKSLFMNELTWMEIRDQMAAGYKTAIVMTGGLEMNGPYMVTDKHQIIGRTMAAKIAEKLGNTLVATVVAYVPEGNLESKGGLIGYPGTIGVSQTTFESLITDISTSLLHQGFQEIILLGDSGGNQDGLKKVAQQMNKSNHDAKIRYVPQYYGYDKVMVFQETLGIEEVSEGIHDIFRDTAILLLDDPEHIREAARRKKGLYHINGVDLNDTEKIRNIANKIIDFQVNTTVYAIQELRPKD
ncbi:MAG: hypothetical protein Mars2KO_42040 [Maribacter sp.]